MQVLIPSALHSYTKASKVEVAGATLSELLSDLDRQFPGLRFRVIDEQDRMRGHMRLFVNDEQVFDLSHRLHPTGRGLSLTGLERRVAAPDTDQYAAGALPCTAFRCITRGVLLASTPAAKQCVAQCRCGPTTTFPGWLLP